MAKYGGITFTGNSGEKYYFQAWPLETRFKSIGAVFFVTKRECMGGTFHRMSHERIYIGQTGNLADPLATQSQFTCFNKHGANCVCVHPDASEERRLAIEQDLAARHSTSCNQ